MRGSDDDTLIGIDGGQAAGAVPDVDPYARLTRTQWRGIRLGSWGLVLGPDRLYEIVEAARISPVPGIGRIFKGLVNHRSNVAPVYDLNGLTGDAPAVWERRRLMIMNSGRDAVALKLYELPVEVRPGPTVDAGAVTGVPDTIRPHVRESYQSGGVVWLVMDFDAFFTELSATCLEYDPERVQSAEVVI